MTLYKWRIYFTHLGMSTVRGPKAFNAFYQFKLSSRFHCKLELAIVGTLSVRARNFLLGYKICSNSGGVFHQLTLWIVIQSWMREQCLESLSCINLCSMPKGRRCWVRMFTYTVASMTPVIIQFEVAPSMLIPARTFTFTGCFERGLGLAFLPSSSFHNNVIGEFQSV